jgi:hypothetical protein
MERVRNIFKSKDSIWPRMHAHMFDTLQDIPVPLESGQQDAYGALVAPGCVQAHQAHQGLEGLMLERKQGCSAGYPDKFQCPGMDGGSSSHLMDLRVTHSNLTR